MICKSQNSKEFFAYIDKLTDEDKYTECINVLQSIPIEERDYQVCYQLARAYQNFAIIGDDDKGTPNFIGDKMLLKSIDILNSVKEEGKDKVEWNMRMAFGYQYLTAEEEKAIPYAMRWAQLYPEDENALEVLKECKEEVEKRKQRANTYTDGDISQEIAEIDEDWGIYLCREFAFNLPAVIRLNLALMNFELTSNYPKSLQLQILYKNVNNNGFPTSEEYDHLYHLEDAVLEIIEKHRDILAGVVKCDERVHIFVYAKSDSGYANEISKMMSENFPNYAYTFAAVEDKDWKMYFNMLYPNPYEYRSIMNSRLIESIKNNGDSMVPRVLEHCLYFKTEEKRKAFLTKVMEEGFQKLELENNDGGETYDTKYPYRLVVGREDDFENIDDIVFYLMDLAEEFYGNYDGWGCFIVK